MHADFLAAICAEPDEPVHRLVYADWLEEKGRTATDAARAELIRVQFAREAADPDGEDYWALRTRERLLVNAWGARLAGDAAKGFARMRYRGGFLDAVAVTEPLPLPRLLAQYPVTAVDFTSLGWWPELAAHLPGIDASSAWLQHLLKAHRAGGLAQLRHLGLPASEEGRLFDLLATDPPPALRSLALGGSPDRGTSPRMGSGLLTALVRSPWLRQLRSLRLNVLGPPGHQPLATLSRSEAAAGLRDLAVCESSGSWADADAHLAGVERLTVVLDRWSGPGTAEFLWRVPLPSLRHLRVDGPLRGAPAPMPWPRLRTLEVTGEVDPDSLRHLVASPGLGRLRRLALGEPGQYLSADLAALEGRSESGLALREILLGEGVYRSQFDPGPLFRSELLGRVFRVEISSRAGNPAHLAALTNPAVAPALRLLSWTGKDPTPTVAAALGRRFGAGFNLGGGLGTVRADFPGEEGWL